MTSLKQKRARERYRKRLKQGDRGLPAATIAFYGPDDQTATKVVLSLVTNPDGELAEFERWTSDGRDLRTDADSMDRIVALLDRWRPKSIISADRIIGCPHEEGTDYPEGETCPECPFWANVDRRTGAPAAVSIGWYNESEWARVKATAADPERFEDTFEQWVVMAEVTLARLQETGTAACKCFIEADELEAWCSEHGLRNDAAARARFVVDRTRSMESPSR